LRAAPVVPVIARYTWARHWPAALLEGVTIGIASLAAFAAKRSLGAADEIVPLLIAVWQFVWIFAPAVGPWLARSHPQRVWRVLAVAANLPLLLVAFVAVTPTGAEGEGTGDLTLFIVLLIAYYAASIGYMPHRSALMRTNYDHHVRGRMFGLFLVVNLLAAGAAAKLSGYLLDEDPRWLRLLFPVAAVAGCGACLLYGRIKWRRRRQGQALQPPAEPPLRALASAWRQTARILREDRAFRTFEIGFMLYGFGFLCSVGVLVLFAEGELGLSYKEWTSAQSLAFPLGQVVGAALFGRFADRAGILRSTAAAFAVLGVFFALLGFVSSAEGLVAACALWGLAMGGVSVGWSLGPLHFAPDGEAHMYFAVHFSCVGIRSVFAPFLGFAVKEHFSYPAAFGLSTVLVGLGAVVLLRLHRRSA